MDLSQRGKNFAFLLEQYGPICSGNNLPPAMLISGRAGVGKLDLALKLLSFRFCEFKNACGSCPTCLKIAERTHNDILVMDFSEKNNIKIEDLTPLFAHINLKPEGPKGAQVVIITEIERLTVSAANRMLKVLEEPPPQVMFFLIAKKPYNVLGTILSRCLKINLEPPPREGSLATLLKWQEQENNCPGEKNSLDMALRYSGYVPSQAKLMLEEWEEWRDNIEWFKRILSIKWIGEKLLEIKKRLSIDNSKATLEYWLKIAEFGVNELYREYFLTQENSLGQENLRFLRMRKNLSQLKRIGVDKRIALNTQSALEMILTSD